MFCRKCGSKLLPNSKVCSKCGTPITTGEICGGFWDLVPGNGAQAGPMQDPYDRTNRIPQQPSGTGAKKKKKGGRGMLIFVSILCVVLLFLSLIQMVQIQKMSDDVVLLKQSVDMDRKDMNEIKDELTHIATSSDAIKADTDRISATLEELPETATVEITEGTSGDGYNQQDGANGSDYNSQDGANNNGNNLPNDNNLTNNNSNNTYNHPAY